MIRTLTFALSLVVLLFTLWDRLLWVLIPYPTSTDGFYYLQEIAHRLRYGAGYYTSFSPYFNVTTALAQLLGLNAPMTYPLLVLIPLSIASLGLALLAAHNRQLALAPLCAAIPWVSDLLFFRFYAYPRQGLAVALLLFAAALLLYQQSRIRALGYLTLGLASICHAAGALLAALLLLAVRSGGTRSRTLIGASIAALGALLTYAAIAGQKGIFRTTQPLWGPSWLTDCRTLGCSAFEYTDYFLTFAVAGALLVSMFMKRPPSGKINSLVMLGAYFALLLPIWENDGFLATRLAFCAYVLLLLTLTMSDARQSAAIALILIAVSQFAEHQSYDGRALPHKTLIAHAQKLKMWIPHDALVRANHGDQFIVTYVLNRKAVKSYPKGKPYYELLRRNSPRPECIPLRLQLPTESTRCVDLGNRWIIVRRLTK